MGVNSAEGVIPSNQPNLLGQAVHVPNRTAHGNGKAGTSGQASFESHPVAPQETTEGVRITQIPIHLPNHPDLVSQAFNGARHRDLASLNLHAWLLEPRQSRNKDTLAQWRYKLRLFKALNQSSL